MQGHKQPLWGTWICSCSPSRQKKKNLILLWQQVRGQVPESIWASQLPNQLPSKVHRSHHQGQREERSVVSDSLTKNSRKYTPHHIYSFLFSPRYKESLLIKHDVHYSKQLRSGRGARNHKLATQTRQTRGENTLAIPGTHLHFSRTVPTTFPPGNARHLTSLTTVLEAKT